MSLFNSFEISVNAMHEQVNRGYEEESSEDEKTDCLSEVINFLSMLFIFKRAGGAKESQRRREPLQEGEDQGKRYFHVLSLTCAHLQEGAEEEQGSETISTAGD